MKIVVTDNVGIGLPIHICNKIMELQAMIDGDDRIKATLLIEIKIKIASKGDK